MRCRLRPMWAAVSLAALVTACGQSPTVVTPGFPVNSKILPYAPTNGTAAGPQQAPGEKIKQAAVQALTASSGFKAEVQAHTEGHYKQGKRVADLRTFDHFSKLVWMKPNKIRCEIVRTTNFLLEGAAMVSEDGEAITAKGKGVLGLFPIHLKASDPTLVNVRNHKFKDALPDSLLQRFTGATAIWTAVGQTTVEGRAAVIVDISNVKHLDPEITKESIWLDAQTYQIRRLSLWEGSKVAMDFKFQNFQWSPRVTAATFKL